MIRLLTGIQSSGRPHLGNIVGLILPTLRFADNPMYESLFFIADLHSLTTIRDSKIRKNYIHATAAAWLVCGLDPKKVIFYRQSKIPEVCELTWFLNCFTPYPMLANAHAFKEKSQKLSKVHAGLLTYPVLMAADILLYKASLIPVNKDQLQHVEITRDIAQTFNRVYSSNIFVVPEAQLNDNRGLILGTDGQNKMSKSYNNIIDIFVPEKELYTSIMSIRTDSTPFEASKNPLSCVVFQLYSRLASTTQVNFLREKYEKGNYGYGDAKKELFSLIMEQFAFSRKLYNEYMKNEDFLNQILMKGEEKARSIAKKTIHEIRTYLGF